MSRPSRMSPLLALTHARYRGRVWCKEGTVRGVAHGACASVGRDRWEERGAVETDHGPGVAQPGLCHLPILVGRGYLLLQPADLGVRQLLPPLITRLGIALCIVLSAHRF